MAVRAVVYAGPGSAACCAGATVVRIYHSAARGVAGGVLHAEYLTQRSDRPLSKRVAWDDAWAMMGGGVLWGATANTRAGADKSIGGHCTEVGSASSTDVGGATAVAPGIAGLHTAATGYAFSGADASRVGFATTTGPHRQIDTFSTQAIVADGVEPCTGRPTRRTATSACPAQRLPIRPVLTLGGQPLPDLCCRTAGHDDEARPRRRQPIATAPRRAVR